MGLVYNYFGTEVVCCSVASIQRFFLSDRFCEKLKDNDVNLIVTLPHPNYQWLDRSWTCLQTYFSSLFLFTGRYGCIIIIVVIVSLVAIAGNNEKGDCYCNLTNDFIYYPLTRHRATSLTGEVIKIQYLPDVLLTCLTLWIRRESKWQVYCEKCQWKHSPFVIPSSPPTGKLLNTPLLCR